MPKIELLNIDCMEYMKGLKDKAFDLAIVDPPYGIGLDFTNKNGLGGGRLHVDKDWNDEIPSEEYFSELHRVSTHQIIWGCNYYAKFIPAVGRIIHDKQLLIAGTKIMFSEADLASCSLQKRITIFRYRWNGNVQGKTINWNNTGPDARIHPTQKPISLYSYCLNYAKPGWKILDTHLGSGSSAIAAHQMGFDFTGTEIDKDYYDAACKRFKEQTMQQSMF